MARDFTALFARAERAYRGEPPTVEEIERMAKAPRVWRPCRDAHDWRLVYGNGGHRCAVATCKVYSNHADDPATCSECGGPTCTSGGRCPDCGGVFP